MTDDGAEYTNHDFEDEENSDDSRIATEAHSIRLVEQRDDDPSRLWRFNIEQGIVVAFSYGVQQEHRQQFDSREAEWMMVPMAVRRRLAGELNVALDELEETVRQKTQDD